MPFTTICHLHFLPIAVDDFGVGEMCDDLNIRTTFAAQTDGRRCRRGSGSRPCGGAVGGQVTAPVEETASSERAQFCRGSGQNDSLVHGVFVFGFLRNLLHRIPVLHYFPIFIKPEEIHRYVLDTPRPCLVRMKSYQVTLCD